VSPAHVRARLVELRQWLGSADKTSLHTMQPQPIVIEHWELWGEALSKAVELLEQAEAHPEQDNETSRRAG
jgi:hypothetical protein